MPNTAKTAMTAAFWTMIPKMMNTTLTTTVMTAAAWYRFEFVALVTCRSVPVLLSTVGEPEGAHIRRTGDRLAPGVCRSAQSLEDQLERASRSATPGPVSSAQYAVRPVIAMMSARVLPRTTSPSPMVVAVSTASSRRPRTRFFATTT
jgi:hypothetical protein